MKLELYIPSKDKFNKFIYREQINSVSKKVTDFLVGKFGGVTVSSGFGYYKNKDGKTVVEVVQIINCYTKNPANSEEYNTAFGYIQGLANQVKFELEQESVLFTINNEPFFE